MSEKKTSWGAVATWYDDLLEDSGDSYQKNVIMPNVIRIAGPKKGMTILDVACGQGYFSKAFAENGANVTGCDISSELIAIAKKSSDKVAFEVSPADSLKFAKDGSFDVVTIVLALQNIENLAGTIAEASRVLKKNGRLITVLNHPTFRIPNNSSWDFDQNKHVQFRRIDSYMSDSSSKIDMTPGESDSSKKIFTVSFHRPLQTYVKAFNKNNLAVTRLEEWISHKTSEKGPRQAAEDKARKEIPLFLCMESTKI